MILLQNHTSTINSEDHNMNKTKTDVCKVNTAIPSMNISDIEREGNKYEEKEISSTWLSAI